MTLVTPGAAIERVDCQYTSTLETRAGSTENAEGEPVTYCANLLVTNEIGLIGGREPYGFPKLFGEVVWVKEHEIISAYAERPRGKRICTGVLRPAPRLRFRFFWSPLPAALPACATPSSPR